MVNWVLLGPTITGPNPETADPMHHLIIVIHDKPLN
jgi:hypothetical protein